MKRKGITLATLAAGMVAGLHPYSHTVKVWRGGRVSTDTQAEIMRKAFFKRERKAKKFSRDIGSIGNFRACCNGPGPQLDQSQGRDAEND